MHTKTSQGDFFPNKSNKSQLIETFSTHLNNPGVNVQQAISVADTLIASTVLDKAKGEQTVALVGTSTDLLVMLVALGRFRYTCVHGPARCMW